MAAELVGGALLNAAFNVLLERLTPGLIQSINFIAGKIVGKKLDATLLRRLKPSLMAAKVVLNDAELKQYKDRDVKDWLDELRDAVYDLEDLVDEIVTRAATQKKEKNEKKVRDSSLADKLKEITATIEYIVGQKDVLNLDNISETETLSWRPPVTSVEASKVYGREKEKEDIIGLMSNGEGAQLSVIPIVGMGGVGKTTLVNSIYNDEDVKRKFDFKVCAWVCVSEAFDLLKIAQTIIKSVSPYFVCDYMDLNLLQLHLTKKLKGKRFLIVLDDVWSDKYSDWDALKNLLHNGVKGCKILVTTRLECVALMVKTISSFYHLEVLSEKDCLSIFKEHAFPLKDSIMDSCLEKVGGDVASKCKGLPLAAKVLGGLFRSNPDFEDWNNVLKDVMWDSLENEIIPALRVSYYYLPPYLKQCFAYCSLFPKGYQFSKTELVLMWMAEGFLLPSKGKSTLEEVGHRYFDDLTSRSLFQPVPKKVHFVLHDLIHELATHVGGDFHSRLGESGGKIGKKTRHLFCNLQNCSDNKVFQKLKGLRTFIGFNIPESIEDDFDFSHSILSNLPYLRTLSLQDLSALRIDPNSIEKSIHLRYLNLSGTPIACLPNSICKLYNLQTLELCRCRSLKTLPSDMQDLVNLRYLDVSQSNIVSLPDMQGLVNLQYLDVSQSNIVSLPDMQGPVNLRYLDVSQSNIVSLPDSLCKLYNLQALKLSRCNYLEMLPSDMRGLENLRHLDISGTRLKEMPRGLGNLKDLQFLSDFIVGKEQETRIGVLGRIPHLKDGIIISKLENVKSKSEASEVKMKKKHIKDLTLSWSYDGDAKNPTIKRDILTDLQPHQDLEKLKIEYYRGETFPDWLGSDFYLNMTLLQLSHCDNCYMLPGLGLLPALKELLILGLESVVNIGVELLKGNSRASMIPFASLEILRFSCMTSWKQWHLTAHHKEAFPKLRQLELSDCEKLVGNLPFQLLNLEILEIVNCPSLSYSIPRCPKLQNLQTRGSVNVVWEEDKLPPSLCNLEITGCRMMESMLEALSKPSDLRQLTISDCSNVSTPMIHLPPSLQHLNIFKCEKVDFVMRSTTHLQNLQSISIEECRDVKCFPKVYSLPSSLKTLELSGFSCLEILNCKGLEDLTSLQQLKILDCFKLQKLLGEKLPAFLKELHIRNCPFLEEKYRKKDRQLFCQISHIPDINLPPEWHLPSITYDRIRDAKWTPELVQQCFL